MEYEKPSARTFLLKENGQKSVLDSQEPILLVVSREFPRFFAPKVIRLHLVYFISIIYKQHFFQLVKFPKKISNKLVFWPEKKQHLH